MDITYKTIVLMLLSYSSYTDIKRKEIMMMPVYVSLLVGVLGILIPLDKETINIMGIIPGFIMLFISTVSHGEIGKGDAYLAIAIGLLLGVRSTLLLLLIGFLIAAIYAVICVFRKLDKKCTFPFAPFMLAGYMGVLLIA